MSIEIPYGFTKEDKVFKNAWGDHEEREIGEIRDDNEEKSIAFFVNRYEELKKKVDEVTQKIDETDNKGSFLMKLVHLKNSLPTHDGLGDYKALDEKITSYESLVQDIIDKNRERNTEIKSGLVEEAREIEKIINWKEATAKVVELKERWIKTGAPLPEKKEQLESDFWDIITLFYERKKQFFEDKNRLIELRKEKYEALVKEAEIIKDLSGKQRESKEKALLSSWNELGGIPAEFYKPLNQAFHKALKNRALKESRDYSELLAWLEKIKSGELPFEKAKLDQIKKSIYKDRSKQSEKSACLGLIQVLNERDFLEKVIRKRFSDFSTMDKSKQKGIKIGILKDLISRDKEELKTIEDNATNFVSRDGKMNKLIEGKIKSQNKKINTKLELIDWIESGYS